MEQGTRKKTPLICGTSAVYLDDSIRDLLLVQSRNGDYSSFLQCLGGSARDLSFSSVVINPQLIKKNQIFICA